MTRCVVCEGFGLNHLLKECQSCNGTGEIAPAPAEAVCETCGYTLNVNCPACRNGKQPAPLREPPHCQTCSCGMAEQPAQVLEHTAGDIFRAVENGLHTDTMFVRRDAARSQHAADAQELRRTQNELRGALAKHAADVAEMGEMRKDVAAAMESIERSRTTFTELHELLVAALEKVS